MAIRIISRTLVCAALICPGALATDLSETPGVDSFSSDFQDPTILVIEAGSNLVSGQVGASGTGTLLQDGTDGGTDADYFTIVVPNGLFLEQIFVNRYNQLQRGFAIYAPGAQFAAPTDLGGGTVFYPFADGALFLGDNDIVPRPPAPLFIGSSAPLDPSDQGFNVDLLPSGSYSFLIQENQLLATDYVLNFVATAVPEPSSLALAAPAFLLLWCWRRRISGAHCKTTTQESKKTESSTI